MDVAKEKCEMATPRQATQQPMALSLDYVRRRCVYWWAKNPPVQPPEAWPPGPWDEIKLCFAEDTMNELVEMGAAEWLDNPLTAAESNRLRYVISKRC